MILNESKRLGHSVAYFNLNSKQIIRFDPAVATLGGLQDHNLLHFTFVDAPVAAAVGILLSEAIAQAPVEQVLQPLSLFG